ncbi:hypothetical protein B7494_g3351 [Chlorociboria aeruginascens]|nr:hypothetical protein B7494_g3351 [Chlorociboria aeruginascens]
MENISEAGQNPPSTTTEPVAEVNERQINGTISEMTRPIIDLLPEIMRGNAEIVNNPESIQALRTVVIQVLADSSLRNIVTVTLIRMDRELYDDHIWLRRIVHNIISGLISGATNQAMVLALLGVWMDSGNQLRLENRALRPFRMQREGAQGSLQAQEVQASTAQEAPDSTLRPATSDSIDGFLRAFDSAIAHGTDEQSQEMAHTSENREAELVVNPSREEPLLIRGLPEQDIELDRRIAQEQARIAEERRVPMEIAELLRMVDESEEPPETFGYREDAGLARAKKSQKNVRAMLHRDRVIGRWIWGFDELGGF